MERALIIAEAGVNHNGDISIAKEMIDAAAKAGADFVKFQTFKSEALVAPTAKLAEYQKKGTKVSSQFEMLQKLELSDEQHYELKEYCDHKDISFLSTAFDLDSLDFLHSLGLKLFKVPSGEITNLPYLRKVGSLAESIILSTGMSTMDEISQAVEVLIQSGSKKSDIVVLHCNTEYPTPFEDVNLRAMLHIHQEFGVKVGYSDHTLGIEVPIAAVALGACVIEKHFTLNRSFEGPDHQSSLEPAELSLMVSSIRNTEKAVGGNGQKHISPSEQKNRNIARKSIHYAHEICAGTILKETDLIMLRPGSGISPMDLPSIVGKKLKVAVEPYQLANKDHFEG